MKRRIALCAAVAGAMAVMAPAAGASIGPVKVALSPATATAGSTGNLGTDITFSPSSGDSVKDLTLAQDAAKASGAATPLGKQAQEMYKAFDAASNGGVDFSGIINHVRGLAGKQP